jgi:hypothetical protein
MTAKNKKPIRAQNPSRPTGGASAANDNRSPAKGRDKKGGDCSTSLTKYIVVRTIPRLALRVRRAGTGNLGEYLKRTV